MPWFDIWNWSGFTWTSLAKFCGVLLITGVVTAGISDAFHLLESSQRRIWLLSTTLVLIIALLGIDRSTPKANLSGQITWLGISGNHQPPFALAAISIKNSGNAASIVRSPTLSTIIGGNQYTGVVGVMPEKMTGHIGTETVTYYGKDSLERKISTPIPAGGVLTAVGLFIFQSAPPNVLNRPTTYRLRYKDVFGAQYETSIATTGQALPNGGS